MSKNLMQFFTENKLAGIIEQLNSLQLSLFKVIPYHRYIGGIAQAVYQKSMVSYEDSI